MTARAQSRELDRFRSLGAAGGIPKPFDPMTLAASLRTYIEPPDVRFDAMRHKFLQRVDGDLLALSRHWSALENGADAPSSLAGIRSIAHGLAGAGGIFGFDEISNAAAALEEAIPLEDYGRGSMSKIRLALERVGACAEITSGRSKTAHRV
jgi:HPt (histidine-containing phosphotransfer) domain-containing protein